MVTDYDSQRKKIEKDLTPMETRLAELAAEQARLKPQADKMRIQLDRLMVDLTSMQQLRKEEAAALETVQSQLRKYIA
jgi:chromosome segregation ATPase